MMKYTGTDIVKALKWISFALDGVAVLWTAIGTALGFAHVPEVAAVIVAVATFCMYLVGYDKTSSREAEATAILEEVADDGEDVDVEGLLTESEVEQILGNATIDLEDNQNGTKKDGEV